MLNSCIEYCIENEHTVSVATPTGCLACLYKSALPDSVTCETIHSIFQYPVKEGEHPSINWYIIDETSQVSIPIFQHILNTIQVLHLKPLLIVGGDFAQQQPLSTIAGNVHQVSNIASGPQFLSIFRTLPFTQQCRITDNGLAKFPIAYTIQQAYLTAAFQQGKIVCFTQVDKTVIVKAHLNNTNAIFFTVSNDAAIFVNQSIISNNKVCPVIATIQCTKKQHLASIFQGLPIML